MRNQLEETLLKLLVTLFAAMTIVAMRLSGGAAAKTTDIYQLAHQNVSITTDGFFAIKGQLSVRNSARLHGVFGSLNARLAGVDRRPTAIAAVSP